ncbi:MAG: metallo-mystery pair system four-Cys motif protein [Gallionellaceae bacterium]|nr:MAG: metallo-mystery pair system four-Cys motif protein [Gallionellaceae bacterium]
MLSESKLRKGIEVGVGVTAIAVLVSGCLGGNSSSTPAAATASLSGVVADGYLSNAKVCLDTNSNGACDAGEPSGTTNANGAYTISGITAGQETQFPIVAEVPSTSVDQDTNAPVGSAFTLTSPAGASFVSPLTTLVQDKVAAGASAASAVAAVGQALGIPAASGVSALDNYVALKGGATDQTNGHFRAHEAAKTVAAVLKLGKSTLGVSATANTDFATQRMLLGQAEAVLQMQATSNAAAVATMFSKAALNVSSIPGAGTLKALIAANKASAATATQAVTVNFDVLNGAAAVGTTGCAANSLTLGIPNVASGVTATGSLKDLRFYVSNVALIDASGNYAPVVMAQNANQDANVALMDFEDATNTCAATGTAATYTAIQGKVAPGTYVGIAFDIGVPGRLNHINPADAATPAPLQNTAMAWMWQSGRKFTKIEFTGNATSGAATTMVHLGATGCRANPAMGEVLNGCASPNRMHVMFATGFNAAANKIALDLGSLFAGLDLTTKKTWMSGKMMMGMMGGDPAYYFGKFQIDMATGLPIADGANQTLFVVK